MSSELERLEREVEQGLSQARDALGEIRKRELYREAGHGSWADYADARWLGRQVMPAVHRALTEQT